MRYIPLHIDSFQDLLLAKVFARSNFKALRYAAPFVSPKDLSGLLYHPAVYTVYPNSYCMYYGEHDQPQNK